MLPPPLLYKKMAARVTACSFVLFGLSLLSIILFQFEPEDCLMSGRIPLVSYARFSPSMVPRYQACSAALHLRYSKKALWHLSVLLKLKRGQNTLLLRAGDIERNPGPNAEKKKSSQLTMVHVNTRSLLYHFDDVAALMSTHCPDILALSETWLDPSVDDCEICLPGFSLFRCDCNRSGGVVAIYCSDQLPCSVLSCGTSASGVKFLWVSDKSGSFHPWLLLSSPKFSFSVCPGCL